MGTCAQHGLNRMERPRLSWNGATTAISSNPADCRCPLSPLCLQAPASAYHQAKLQPLVTPAVHALPTQGHADLSAPVGLRRSSPPSLPRTRLDWVLRLCLPWPPVHPLASVSAQDAPRKPSLLATRFSGSGGFYTPLSLGTAHSSILCVQGCLMPSPPWNRAGSTSAYGHKSPGTPSTLLGPWQTLDKFLLSKYQYLTELLGHLGYFFTFCKLNFWTRGKCYFVTLKKTHK